MSLDRDRMPTVRRPCPHCTLAVRVLPDSHPRALPCVGISDGQTYRFDDMVRVEIAEVDPLRDRLILDVLPESRRKK